MYSAARSATTSLAQGLAVEAAPYDIQVNPIGPAWFENPTYYPERLRDRFQRAVEREVPLRRLGRQDELGALIGFLVSGQAAPMTGQFLPFTAGTRLRR
jgi:3-oxoacyl-[acyl-carrier protein] reductase